ncbi:hypothetical protein PENTCL1PPCAC_2861 [Pristionchus entomophagus]|uniref:Ribosomal protein n=1 Tax=Pristionchus entomophagus TaxID=358040 RepID=A0AAV5SBM9_9BILA|nr:hypothetical protein PENTCL1PPCAC_2861 [Pristionchus entomophagus]
MEYGMLQYLKLARVPIDEDIDWLDVTMSDSISGEEIEPVEELPDVDLDVDGGENSLDHLVQCLGHVSEDEGLTFLIIGCGVPEDVEKFDDIARTGPSHRSQNDHLVTAHRVLRPGLLDGDL